MPAHLIMPFLASAGYTLSSLFFKKAYQQGATTQQAFHWANFIAALLLGGTVLLGSGMAVADFWKPALVAGLIYGGALSTFAAMQAGDVSLVTPLLGAKVIFVALLTPWLAGAGLSSKVWIACLLTGIGIFFIGLKDFSGKKGSPVAILYCLASCLFFAISDVLLQVWAPQCGGFTFLGSLAVLNAIYSLGHSLLTNPAGLRVSPTARKSVLWGSLLLALQGITMGVALGFFHDAARVNVVYGCRGMWSLVLVWYLGKSFGNAESTSRKDAFGWRVLGCLLLTTAIVLALG